MNSRGYNTTVGILYLVATPIGNMEDITFRALRVLREAVLIAAEDTRHTRKLLSHYDIHTDLISYHEHNKDRQGERVVEALSNGDAALVSDAGTPLLSDPGYELVQQVLEAGHQVCPVPGPSAPLTALVVSGLPTDSFTFLGYIPRKAAERKRMLEDAARSPHTQVFFEAPHRLRASLADLEAAFGSERRMAACREMTKKFEEVRRGTAAEVRSYFERQEPRGEFTLVVDGAQVKRWTESKLQAALEEYLQSGMSRGKAAKELAKLSGWPRNRIYELSLEE